MTLFLFTFFKFLPHFLSFVMSGQQTRVIEIAPGKFVGGDHPCFVLGEAGINHNGEIENAKRLIDMAKLCGVCGPLKGGNKATAHVTGSIGDKLDRLNHLKLF